MCEYGDRWGWQVEIKGFDGSDGQSLHGRVLEMISYGPIEFWKRCLCHAFSGIVKCLKLLKIQAIITDVYG